MDTPFKIDEVKKMLELTKRELPVNLANQAKNFFVKSWSNQGWEGKPWETPKRKIPGTPEYKYPMKKGLGRRTKATLVNKGTLRRCVSNSIRTASFPTVHLVVALPYAFVHNDGAPMRNGKRMPKRTFMKDSPTLRIMQKDMITKAFTKVYPK